MDDPLPRAAPPTPLSLTPSTRPREAAPVPSGRLSRLAGMGARLAGSVIGGTARAALAGRRADPAALLWTPDNAARIVARLSTLRGAAMKLGQLLSMDAGDLVPPELAAVLAALRADARPMPEAQLRATLNLAWGRGWEARLAAFDPVPVAAASIGQVHRARLADGRAVAVKVQYWRVADAIDSDIDNVAGLLRWSGLVPDQLDLTPLIEAARAQLRAECDYDREGDALDAMADALAHDPGIAVPRRVAAWSNARVLTMTDLPSIPIETLAGAGQPLRDAVGARLVALALTELFELGMMQTDPNFANFGWDGAIDALIDAPAGASVDAAAGGRLVLYDFGATHAVPPTLADGYATLALAGLDGDVDAVLAQAVALGLLPAATVAAEPDTIRALTAKALALVADGRIDCGRIDQLAPIRDGALALARDRRHWHAPPADSMFINRKLAGLYLLLARLGAVVDLAPVRAACRERLVKAQSARP